MDIKIIVTNTARKSLIFISNTFKTLTLDDALHRAKKGELENMSVVRGKYGEYLRSLPNASEKDNIDSLSIRPEIIATLYGKGRGDPKKNPKPSERGVQIANEFYEYAKKWI